MLKEENSVHAMGEFRIANSDIPCAISDWMSKFNAAHISRHNHSESCRAVTNSAQSFKS